MRPTLAAGRARNPFMAGKRANSSDAMHVKIRNIGNMYLNVFIDTKCNNLR
jgi:hypothetical protein